MGAISTSQSSTELAVYFTLFNVDQKKVGFTDILMRWSTLYKLGVSLGYTYVHKPIICKNTSKIYNFLGFNNSFNLQLDNFLNLHHSPNQKIYNYRDFDYSSIANSRYSPRTLFSKIKNFIVDNIFFSRYRLVDIVINETFLQKYSITDLNDLQNYVKNTILRQTHNPQKIILIRFQLSGARKKFYYLINSQLADFPDRLNLRTSYFEARDKQPIKSKFLADKLKLLVHIRQGDTAFIETPWKTFIPVYGKKLFTELNDPSQGGYADLIDVNDYYHFVKKFTEYWDAEKFSLVVSSDGYKKAFSLLHDNLSQFNFNSKQIKQLQNTEILYQKKFNIFDEFKYITYLIGETDENLYNLIHSTLEADIIIMGFRNTLGMLLKIIAHYYDFDNPPIIIELYKKRKPFDSKSLLGIDSNKAEIIPVKLDDCNWEDLILKVNKAINARRYIKK
ncbi:MAG: hypothetical protein QNJ41_14155 [Xenococcaceae cyanobacterium MO_188.B32]|nr:hypothetical protein [Xenococcaceae cyanobacterium MO_188.B32]